MKTKQIRNDCIYSKVYPLKSGNEKIGINTLVLNFSIYSDCPSRLKGYCNISKYCYARKFEYLYKDHFLKYNTEHNKFINENSPEKLLNYLIDFIDSCYIERKIKIKYLRINEYGDFRNKSDINKVNHISSALNSLYGIKTYSYTKRKDLLNELKKALFIINFSEKQYKGLNCFKTIDISGFKALYNQNYKALCFGDCKKCNLCKVKQDQIIYEILRKTGKDKIQNLI